MGGRVICACLAGLIAQVAWAAGAGVLPPLSQSQLADAVEARQNRLRRFDGNYTITYGTMQGDGASSAVFVPKSPPIRVTGRYAFDRSANHEFIEERFETGSGLQELQAAFDGKVGTRLGNGGPGSQSYLGDIASGLPRELAPGYAGHWRPSQSLYRPVGGNDLADMIRQAKRIAIVPDDSAAGGAYRVTLTVEESRTITWEGAQRPATRIEIYRLWLDPERGFLPARFEHLMMRDRSDIENLAGIVTYERVTTGWTEVEPGLWFPSAISAGRPGRTEDLVARVVIDSLRVGAEADVPEHVAFPDGTHVTDAVAQIKYRAGVGQFVDDSVDFTATEAMTLEEAVTETESVPADTSPGSESPYPEESVAQSTPLVRYVAGVAVAALAVAGLLLWKSRRRRRRQS